MWHRSHSAATNCIGPAKSRQHDGVKINRRLQWHGCTRMHLLLSLLIAVLPGQTMEVEQTRGVCSPCPSSCSCGVLDTGLCKVDCASASLRSIPSPKSMPKADTISHLDFTNNDITSLDERAFQNLTNLEVLHLLGNELQNLPRMIFTAQSHLKQLTLTRNPLKSLDPDIFANLTALETLSLNVVPISSLPEKIFSKCTNIKYIYMTRNSMVSLPQNIFLGLSKLESLYIDRNQLTSLPKGVFKGLSSLKKLKINWNQLRTLHEDIFSDLTSLSQLYIGSNPFFCNCGLAWLYSYAKTRTRSRLQIMDSAKLLCASPRSVYKKAISTLPASHFACGAADFISCYKDKQTGATVPILFQNMTTEIRSSSDCKQLCFTQGNHYGVYTPSTCLCGKSNSSACRCLQAKTDRLNGTSLCRHTFLVNSFKVTTNMQIQVVHPYSSQKSVQLISVTNLDVSEYWWDFGDRSDLLQTSKNSVSHMYPVGGHYAVNVTAVAGLGKESVQLQVKILDPIVAMLSGPQYYSTTQTVDLYITVHQGSGVWIDWLYPNSTEALTESIIQVPTYIAGTAVFSHQDDAVEYLRPTPTVISPRPGATSVLLFPGLWFTEQGFIQRWVFEVVSIKSGKQIHLQVYRPTCTSRNHFVYPGCQKKSSPFLVCASSSPVCNQNHQQTANCNASMQYCPISRACHSIFEPCNCNGYTSQNHCWQGKADGDTEDSNDYIMPKYTMVNNIIVNIKASRTRILYQVDDASFEVHPFDVIGVQYDSKDTVLQCNSNSKSGWKQKMLMWTKTDWITPTKTVNPVSAKTKNNVMCHIRAIYTKPVVVKAPENVTKTNTDLSPGSYQFMAKVRNDIDSVTVTKTVTIIEAIQKLELVHPVVQSAKNNLYTVAVEVGVPTLFLVRISQGHAASANWTINNIQTNFSAKCPRISQQLLQCQNHLDGESFASALYKFNNSAQRQLIIVAKNAVSEQRIVVYVNSYIKISGLQMNNNRNEIVEVNKAEKLMAIVSQGTGITYKWNISDGTVLVAHETNITHTFQSTGLYSIKLTASNPLSSVSIIRTLQAYHRAYPQNLSIEMPSVVGLGDSVTATVSLNMVSRMQVTATWSWEKYVTKNATYKMPEGQTFVAESFEHVFDQIGNYTFQISVSDAFEVISAKQTIEIIEKIAQVSLHIPRDIVATKEKVSFVVYTKSRVNPLTYDWFINANRMSNTSHAGWQYTFVKPGNYTVTVVAKNRVSSASSSQIFTVEEPISGLHLLLNGTARAGLPCMLTAKIFSGTGVNFMFDTNIAHPNVIAQSDNEFHYTYANPGQYNVTVTATNRISQEFAWLLLVVRDVTSLFVRDIKTVDCTAAGQLVSMTVSLVHHDQAILHYNWHFGDGKMHSGKGLASVSHTYSSIGSYNVSVAVSDSKDQNQSIFKTVCVQEPVSGVILRSNSPRPLLTGKSTTVEFVVRVEQGSNYSYIWHYNGKENKSSPGYPFEVQFTTPGMFTFHLTAQNRLNSVNTSTMVIIQEIITELSIQTPAHFLTQKKAYTFNCSVRTGTSVRYTWLFNGTAVSLQSNKSSQVYRFALVGMYTVAVHAHNLVSEQYKTVAISVLVPVGSLRIKHNATTVKEGDIVEFTASLQSGTAAAYNWIICLKLCTTIPSASEKLIYQFETAGKYNINATASNELNSVTNQLVVRVTEVIHGLVITMANLTSDKYYARYKVLHLSGTVEGGTDVSYLWTIRSPRDILSTMSGKAVDFMCSDIGEHEVQLKASNRLGSSLIVQTFEVVEKVFHLEIVANSSAILLGKNVSFAARRTGGSHISFQWHLIHGDLVSSVLEGAASSLVYMFKKPGVYTLKVTAINPLERISARLLLKVDQAIHGVQLLIHSATTPYVPKSQRLVFQATFTKGTRVQYDWIFHDQRVKGNATVKYSFSSIGTYKVKLRISNDVSGMELEKELTVEEELSDFDVQMDRQYVATYSKIAFTTTFTHGSDITYYWNFGDGFSQSTTDSKITHAFSHPGVYNVSIAAANHVSSATKVVEVYVLDKVHGLHFVQWCDQYIATNVPMNLHADIMAGTAVLYQWTLDNMRKEALKITSQKHFQHVFFEPKKYRIRVRASNAISSQEKEIFITVENPIQSVKLLPSQPYFVHQKFSLDASNIGGSNIQYEWSINGQIVSGVASNNLVHTFLEAGVFNISVHAFNNVSSVQDWVTVDVKRDDCIPPTVTPSGGRYREEVRSRKLVLEVYVKLHGCTKYVVIHQWNMFTKPCSSRLGKQLPLNVTTNGPVLSIPALSLNYGSYCVHFSTKFKGTLLEGKTKFQVKILPTPLKAIIKGGSVREFSREKQILLDGTLSYDPDSKRKNKKHLQYKWTCSSKPRGLQATDRCFKPMYTRRVTIPPYKLLPNRTYTFLLRIQSHKRGKTFSSQMVTIKSKTFPVASVECLSCSMSNVFVVSSSLTVKLLGTCQNCGPPRHQKHSYEWMAKRHDGKQLFLNHKSTTTGDNKPNLAIRRGVLQGGYAYTFTLTVRDKQNWMYSGQSSLKLQAHTPPHGGNCSASPTTAVTMETKIGVKCDGWYNTVNNKAPLIFHIYVAPFRGGLKMKQEWYTVYKGTQKRNSFFLSPWGEHAEDGGKVTLKVSVQDQLGAVTLALTQVITLKAPKVPEGVTKTAYLLNLTCNVLPVLERQNNPRALILYAMALIMQLNIESKKADYGLYSSIEDNERDMRIKVRETVTSVITNPKAVPLTSTDEIQQLSFLLKSATAYHKEFKTPAVFEGIMNMIERTLVAIGPYISQIMESEDFSAAYLIKTVQNVINSVKYHSSLNTSSVQVAHTGHQESFEHHMLQNFRPLNRMMVVEMALHIADQIMVYILQTQIADEEIKVFSSRRFLARGQRTRATKIWKKQATRKKCMFQIPRGLLHNHCCLEVFQVMTLMDSNPFAWGFVDGKKITSVVPSLTFRFTNGSSIDLQHLPPNKRVTVAMRTKQRTTWLSDYGDADPPVTGFSGASSFFEKELKLPYRPTDDVPFFTVTMFPNDVKQTKLNTSVGIKHQAAMQIQVLGLVLPGYNETSAESQYDLSVMAYIGKGYIPTAVSHFLALNITSQTMSKGADHRNYTFFIQDAFDGAEEYYITVINMDSRHSVNVSIGVYFSMCQFYNEKTNKWDTSGCVTNDLSLPSVTVCECNHLTIFGASVLVQPAHVNFDDFRTIDIAKNPVAVITVCVLAFFYLVLAVLARHWDIQDLQRIFTVPLCGKDGPFKYEVTVVTGMQAGAGTSANVGIKLYGDRGKSGTRHLSKPGAFQRNSYDVLLVATETSLGDLQRIHIWHDNSGLDPPWYLSRVQVRDLQTDKKYHFLAECWFSVMSQAGFLEKDIMLTAGAELKRFHRKFKEETFKGLCEKHVWLSVVEHTAQSRFTRVQRVTCCFTLLYTFMCVNAMWYGVIQAPTDKELTLGTSTLSWTDVIVGLVTSLVVFPVNFAIMQIFRKSRTRVDPYAYIDKLQAFETVEIDITCDMSRRASSFGSLGVPPLDREDTTESMQYHTRSRCGDSARKGIRSSTCNSHDMGTEPSTSAHQDDLTKKDTPAWWSYDSILNWPEKMPAWNEEQDSRQNSANPIRRRPTYYPVRGHPGRARCESYDSWQSDENFTNEGPQNKKEARGVLKRRMSRKINISENIDEQLDDDFWKNYDCHQANKNMDTSMPKEQIAENIPLETWVNDSSPPKKASRKAGEDSGRSRSVSFTDDSTRPKPVSLVSRSISLSLEGKAEAEPGVLVTITDEKLAGLKNESNSKEETKLTAEANASRSSVEPQHPGVRKYSVATSSGTADSKEFQSEEGMSILQASSSLLYSEKSFDNSTGRSRVQSIPPPPMKERLLLPHWCIYVAYGLCFILNAFSIVLVILYGHRFGREVALRWLLALAFSLFESIFILEPLKVLLLALIIAALATRMEGFDEGGNVELAPLVEAHENIKDVHMKPLGGYALLQAREEGRRVHRMHSLIRHTVIYGIYLLTILAISYIGCRDHAFHMTQTVKGTFIHQTWGTSHKSFGDINNLTEWWDWMDQVVTPGLYKSTTDLNVIHPHLMGVARLRQVRSLTEPCPARQYLVHAATEYRLGTGCYGNPEWAEDTHNYGLGWNKSTPENETVWNYSSAEDLDEQGWQGSVEWYSGGGYTVNLGYSKEDTTDILKKLRATNWIDRGTRAVFVEFTLYNFNVLHSSVVRLLMELPISGGVMTKAHVSTIQLMRYIPGRFNVLLIGKPLLLLILLFMVTNVILGLRQQKLWYFTHCWNWYQLTLVGFTTASLVLYLYTVIEHTNTYQELVHDLTMFTSFTKSACWYHAWQCVNAVVVFLLTVMVAHQLHYIKFMSVYWSTLKKASNYLAGCTIIHVLIVVAFAQLFYLWYGCNVGQFSSMGTAIFTLHGLLRGHSDFFALLQYNHSFTIIFMTTFVAVIMIGVSGLILAVLTHTYKMVRSQMFYHNTLEMQDYEMIEFMIKRFKRWVGITKPKPAFRKVKFQGMPSVSTRSTYSSHSSRDSSGSDQSGSLTDDMGEQVDQLLARAESTWLQMLGKLEEVARLDEQEQLLIDKLEQKIKPEEAEKQNMNKAPVKNKANKSKGLNTQGLGSLRGQKAHQPPRTARTDGRVLPSIVGQARFSGSSKSKMYSSNKVGPGPT